MSPWSCLGSNNAPDARSRRRRSTFPAMSNELLMPTSWRMRCVRLSARQQQVLVWRYYFDESVQQTAGRLGLTESKVKDATHEAVTKLGRLLRSEKASSA